MYLPPEVLIRSFLRSVIRRKPSGVELADVAGVEPAVGVERLGGRLGEVVVAAHDAAAAQQDLAVLGAILTSVPGSGGPTVPNRYLAGRLTKLAALDSVRP